MSFSLEWTNDALMLLPSPKSLKRNPVDFWAIKANHIDDYLLYQGPGICVKFHSQRNREIFSAKHTFGNVIIAKYCRQR